MKRIAVLLLLCLLLCGCAGEDVHGGSDTLPQQTAATDPATEPTGFYDPEHPLTAATNGAVRAYPLEGLNPDGMLPLGGGYLLYSRTDTATRLMVLSGSELALTAQLELPFPLGPEDQTLRRWDGGISYYDPAARCVAVLDQELRELSRIALPEDLTGIPLLSGDRNTLYYCTADAIRALDPDSGISRVLKEIRYTSQSVTGLHLGGTVLECSLVDADGTRETLFLSTATGETQQITRTEAALSSSEDTWYAVCQDGPRLACIFGQPGSDPAALIPGETAVECRFLPEAHAAVLTNFGRDGAMVLDCYDLDTGLRGASLTLEGSADFRSFCAPGEGTVAFLLWDGDSSTLCLWDTSATPTGDTVSAIGPHYTRDDPDYEGLAACTLYAQELSQRHGAEILVYRDAAEVQPWDYEFTFEHHPATLMRELELLDARLQNYPEGFLSALSERFSGLKIALVRQISGSPESGSLETARGIQFWDEDYTAYIVLSTQEDTEYTLYHELCHLIDTVVLDESIAYDQWDLLNPVGFRYDNDYQANQTRNSDEYLREEKRYFIDTYSMSFPKEDRARIMEYAMTEGNESYFQCDTMQAKLRTLCEGIRKAFGLRKSPETFLWEQYLEESLAYTE